MAVYQIVTQYPDTEVIGGTQTRDVQVIGVVTNAHQIYFETRLPRKLATSANLRAAALSFAVTYEALADMPGVADVQWTQEPTATGLLQDHVVLYITSDSGDSTGQIDVPLERVVSPYIDDRVAALRAALNATEGPGG